MSNDIDLQNKPRNNKALAGIILLVVGALLLIHQLDIVLFPFWLFRWPMILIAIGLYSGAKHNFRNSGWLIMVLVGIVFTLDDAVKGYDMGRVTWPIMIIIFGLWMILRRGNRWDKNKEHWDKWAYGNQGNDPNVPPVDPANPAGQTDPADPFKTKTNWAGSAKHTYGDDYIDAVSVFGGVKKTILSKDFKGGDIVNIFGGAELDLTQADINGRVILDITQIFGGTKIVVPSNWQVVSDIAAVFASVDDKRLRSTAGVGSEKILVLKGVSIFAGIDIRSY
jgi:predicted membrane protein